MRSEGRSMVEGIAAAEQARPARPTSPRLILGLAWLTAFSCRSNVLAVGPVLPLMIADLHLSYAEANLLFSVPVLMMGLFAIPSGLIIARFGMKTVLTGSLLLLALGGGLRTVAGGALSLTLFTVVMGAGIGLAQTLLPSLIKEWFPSRAGTATGLYSSGFPIGAVTAASLAIPVLLPLSGPLTWRGPFLLWSGLVSLTLLLAALLVRGTRPPGKPNFAPFGRIFRSRLCWIISLVFMTQSLLYYILNSSLEPYYLSLGWSLPRASLVLSVVNLSAVAGGAGGPILSDWLRSRRAPLIGGAFLATAGMIGLILWPEGLFWLWAFLLGASTAALFTICLIVPVDAAAPDQVGAFAGMMLAVGYGGVVVGPVLIGYLRDLTGNFSLSLLAMLGIAGVLVGLTLAMPETAAPAGGRGKAENAECRMQNAE
ncbi:MAG: MFS transporter [Chloroflexota bacterium]